MKKFLFITMAIMLFVMSVIPVSYASEFAYEMPSYEGLEGINYDCKILTYDPNVGQYHLYLLNDDNGYIESENAYFTTGVNDSNGPYVYLTSSVNSRRAYYVIHYKTMRTAADSTTAYWSKDYYKMTSDSTSLGIIGTTVFLESDVDIKDKDGNLVFPPAPTELYQIIHQMTEKEITHLPTVLVGAMKTLALCGVGCLALLMVLPLFGKVLKRYLPL